MGADPLVLAFPSQEAFQEWLAEHHSTCDGLQLKIAKKGSGIATVSHEEALEVALCYGWIDGRRNALDSDYFLQLFTPRRAHSKWSKRNCGFATALIANGRMQPTGLAQVERAKGDGRWEAAYDAQSTATVPDDLQRELDKHDIAREFFAGLDSTNRFAILYRIQDAKRPETRARRIEKFVAMLDDRQKLYP